MKHISNINEIKLQIVCLLFLLTTFFLSAQIYGNADIGKNIEREWYFTNINVGYVFDIWKFENDIYAGVKTFFLIDDFPLVGSMLRSIYTVGYKLDYSIFYFKIEHYCSHPTINDWCIQKRLDHELWDESGTEIKIGIK